MRILGLPGRIPETHAPLEALVRALGEGEVQRYAFWGADDPDPDPEPEAVRAGQARADLVVTVSFGARVAMAARTRHGLAAAAYVFLGAPVKLLAARGQLADLAAQARAAPTLFIQESADRTGSFGELAAALPPDAQLREIEGASHVYDGVAQLAGLIGDWLPRDLWSRDA